MTDLPGYSGDLNLFIIERAEDRENRAFFILSATIVA
jgi:hypothetical protein